MDDTIQEHELKTINPYFQAVWDGTKTFEFRKDDRGFKVGDVVLLREYDKNIGTYILDTPTRSKNG